jgi:hypothetical protein
MVDLQIGFNKKITQLGFYGFFLVCGVLKAFFRGVAFLVLIKLWIFDLFLWLLGTLRREGIS